VIGLGTYDLRPTLTFSATASTLTVTAANCWLENIKFVSNVDSLVTFVSVGADNFVCKACTFRTSTGKEATSFVTLGTTFDHFLFEDCQFYQPTDPTGTDAAVNTGCFYIVDSEDITVRQCKFVGEFETAIFHNRTTALKNLWVDRCYMQQDLAGAEIINLVAGATGAMTNSVGLTPDCADATLAAIVGTLGTAFVIGPGTGFGNDGAVGNLANPAATLAT